MISKQEIDANAHNECGTVVIYHKEGEQLAREFNSPAEIDAFIAELERAKLQAWPEVTS